MGNHAQQRAEERISACGRNPAEAYSLAERIARAYPRTDIAVRLMVLEGAYGDTEEDILSRMSNGNEVWAIIRQGVVTTIMLRRDNQPRTTEALRVDKVLRVA